MIQISQIPLPPGEDVRQLRPLAAQALGLPERDLGPLQIVRQSVDARHKSSVRCVYTVALSQPDEQGCVRRAPGKNVTLVSPQPYAFPRVTRTQEGRPVIVGTGPAGLFCALFLARAGIPSVVLERGRPLEARCADVERAWSEGTPDPESNVQFGEGGAGTFSDGKLTTGTHERCISAVLETFVRAGAPEDILWSYRPHVGTDLLRRVIRSLREELLGLGCEMRFGHRLEGLERGTHGSLTALQVRAGAETYRLPCSQLVLAPGHSARDTFAMLRDAGVPLEARPFALGVRIEHRQREISRAQYGSVWTKLPPSDYKLACHLPSGRSVFSFCVCPGGQVVASASGPEQIVTNGMSFRARDGENLNGGLLVGVGPEDFAPFGDDVLAGVRCQAHWERAAWHLAGERGLAPAQRVEDFLLRRPSQGAGQIAPSYRPGVAWTALDSCLPEAVSAALREALPLLERKLHGFACPDAVLTGVETRSSSPVRILRGPDCQSALRGLYPCGEGAGYAGGIVSAAVDGIRVAESIAAPQAE